MTDILLLTGCREIAIVPAMFYFFPRFTMSLTNHEIALELVKLITPNMVADYQHKFSPSHGRKPEDYAEFLSAAFVNVLSKLPSQDSGKNQSH